MREYAFVHMLRMDNYMDDSVTYATKTKLDYPAIFDEKKKTHRLKGFAGERHYIALRHALIRIKVRGTDSK